MSLFSWSVNMIKGTFKADVAYAHCDIPCGIYDPHLAQVAAHTVVRMHMLINELEKPGPDATAEQSAIYAHRIARLTIVKEEHAELAKREIRILWGDYFKPDHLQQVPDLHDQFWNAMRLASAARQKNDPDGAQKLLASVQGIAEAFWKTKGADTSRQPSRQGAAGGELVYPA